MPRPRWVSMDPISSSSSYAFLTVSGAIARSSASSRWTGSFAPGSLFCCSDAFSNLPHDLPVYGKFVAGVNDELHI